MRPIYILSKSSRKDKKWTIQTPQGKRIHFGQQGYLDYTQHNDLVRKQSYIARHSVNENWNDLNTAGFWSRYLLWSEPTITDAISKIERKFKIIIKQ
jgi:hypothetical protein